MSSLLLVIAFIGLALLGLAIYGAAVALLLRLADQSQGLVRIVAKLLITLMAAAVPILLLKWGLGKGSSAGFLGAAGAAFLGAGLLAVVGLLVSIIWAPQIGELLAKPFEGLYFGGGQEMAPQPLYSMAEAKCKQGKYAEAISQIALQLEKFPGDFRGVMMAAQIQVEHLGDLPAATQALEQFISKPEQSPSNLAYALNRLSDWHAKYAQDLGAAQRYLERIVEMLPDSSEAHAARQRIAHFGNFENYQAANDRTPIALPHIVGYPGLRPGVRVVEAPAGSPVEAPEVVTERLVTQLEHYPDDNEAREQLALLYARHFHRLDLAQEQIEQLLAQPKAPQRELVRWLNMLADLWIQEANDVEGAKAALERVAQMFPNSAAAENASRRLQTLRLEARVNQTGQTFKLGSYEQRLGLNSKPRERQ